MILLIQGKLKKKVIIQHNDLIRWLQSKLKEMLNKSDVSSSNPSASCIEIEKIFIVRLEIQDWFVMIIVTLGLSFSIIGSILSSYCNIAAWEEQELEWHIENLPLNSAYVEITPRLDLCKWWYVALDGYNVRFPTHSLPTNVTACNKKMINIMLLLIFFFI